MVEIKKSTAVKDAMLMCNQLVSVDDLNVPVSSDCDAPLKIKGIHSISREQSILNKILYHYFL